METAEPKSNGHTAERDARGRFLPGNQAAKGHRHPHARRAVKLAEAFCETVKVADIRAVAKKLVQMARKGDLQAIRELLDRTLGRPPQAELAEFEDQVRLIKWPIAPPATIENQGASDSGKPDEKPDEKAGEKTGETSNGRGA